MAAALVPPELFKIVFTYFLFSNRPYNDHSEHAQRQWVHVNKSELGQFALVSRYWARQTQTKIFNTITLRSKTDFVDLVTMASSPYSNIALYIHELNLVYTPPCVPWIHMVSTTLMCNEMVSIGPGFHAFRAGINRSHFPNCTVASVNVVGPLADNSLRSSLHASLPKRLPAFSLHIRHLALDSVQVANLQDLMRIAGELPMLWSMSCRSLTWKTPPNEEHNLAALYRGQTRHSQSRVRRLDVLTSNCSDSWFIAVLVLALHVLHEWRLGGNDLNVIVETSRVMFELSVDAADQGDYSATSICMDPTLSQHRVIALDGDWRSPIKANFILVKDEFCSTSLCYQHIDKIMLDLLWTSTITEANELALWKSLDDYAASSGVLRYVVIGSKFPAKLTRFVKEVGPIMYHLQVSGRLKYTIRHGAAWKAWRLGMSDKGALANNHAELMQGPIAAYIVSRPEEDERRRIVRSRLLKMKATSSAQIRTEGSFSTSPKSRSSMSII